LSITSAPRRPPFVALLEALGRRLAIHRHLAHADVDGDGRTDVLENVTGGVRVTFGGAAGMQAPQTLPAIHPGQPWVVPGAANVRIVDVNCDGLTDAVFVGETFRKPRPKVLPSNRGFGELRLTGSVVR
jgi:hypothetical protein